MNLTVTYTRLCRLLERLGLVLHGSLHYIGGSDTLPAPLTREEESGLLAQARENAENVISRLFYQTPSIYTIQFVDLT